MIEVTIRRVSFARIVIRRLRTLFAPALRVEPRRASIDIRNQEQIDRGTELAWRLNVRANELRRSDATKSIRKLRAALVAGDVVDNLLLQRQAD